jgi:hypothetical protein
MDTTKYMSIFGENQYTLMLYVAAAEVVSRVGDLLTQAPRLRARAWKWRPYASRVPLEICCAWRLFTAGERL